MESAQDSTLPRGFGYYDDDEIDNLTDRLAAQVTDRALAWIESQAERRFFLFLNYYDPHGPQVDPECLVDLFLPRGTRIDPCNPSAEVT